MHWFFMSNIIVIAFSNKLMLWPTSKGIILVVLSLNLVISLIVINLVNTGWRALQLIIK